ncbi:DUF6651 domain-containing protein [Dokdonella ginsengisoli]|uniref:DUF6651 domain-containing protein n=1 Tax=Dokdonella ginsengisoli TaxID=363846 RepID=A0ABV9R065_9GAMM
MKIKTAEIEGKQYAVLQDGMPIYVHDDGKESPFDAAATVAAIRTRNAEAKANRERAEAAEAKLKVFDGIEDAEAARKALDTLAKLDQKKLIDAGQVDAAVAAALKPVQAKADEEAKRASTLEQQLHNEIVGGAFARSKYITDRLAIPSDMVQAAFGSRFTVKDGKLSASGIDGGPLFSRKNPGSAADFDEALEILIDAYPHKDSILKADNKSGSGAPTNGGGGKGSKNINRAAFEALDPAGRQAHITGGGTVTD